MAAKSSYEDIKRRVQNERTGKTSYEEIKEKVRQERYSEDSAKVDGTYIQSFLDDAHGYLSDSQKELEGMDWGKATSYTTRDNQYAKSKDLNYRGNLINYWLENNKDKLDSKTYTELTKVLSEYQSGFGQADDAYKQYRDYYSQWDSEDSYQTAVRYDGYSKKYTEMADMDRLKALVKLDDGEEKEWLQSYLRQKNYDEKKNADLGALEFELRELEEYKSLDSWYKSNHSVNADDPNVAWMISRRKKLEEKYGDAGNIDSLISQKKKFYNNASRVQEGLKLASVADPTSANYDPNFAQYSGYAGSTWIDDGWDRFWSWDDTAGMNTGYKDIRYDYINDPDTVSDYLARGTNTELHLLSGLHAYSYMTKDQVAIYNYYYATGGKEAADKYLDSIQDSLNAQQGQQLFSSVEGKPVLELAFGIGAGLDQFGSGIKNLFSDKDYIPTTATQYASGMIREDLADTGFKLPEWAGGASLGQIGYDFLNTTANMAPSILTSAVAGVINPAFGVAAGNATMFASTAGNAYQEALNLGYDKGQARAYSTLVGASEVGLQYLMGGIGKLGGKLSNKAATSLASKFDSAYARLAVKYGTNMLAEGTEEYLQEILTPVFKNLALKTDEEIELITEDAIYSMLLGMLSSGFMEGSGISSENGSLIGNLKDMSSKNQANINAMEMYGGFTNELIQEGLASDVGSKSHQFAEIMQRKTDKGKSMSGYEIRQQVQANDAQFAVEDYNSVVDTAKEKLTALGETQDVGKVAKLVAKKVTGQELTRAEIRTLVNSFGSKVAKEMETEYKQAESTAKAYEARYKSLTDRVGEEGRFAVSESGETTVRGKDGAVAIAEITKIEDDQVTVKLESGEEVDAGYIDFASGDESLLYSAVADIERISPAAATAMVQNYDAGSGVSVMEYVNGVDEAYTFGRSGYSVTELRAGTFTGALTNEQMMSAYELGKEARKTHVDADEAKRVKTRTATEKSSATVSKKEKVQQQKARFESDAEVYFMDGKDVKKFDEAVHDGEYDEIRMGGVYAAKMLSKLGIGKKYVFYKSYINDRGERVYKNANGVEKPAPNGIYTKDGTIYIDLNAGNEGQGTTLYTLGHELGHFVKDRSEKQFQILADLVTEAYDKTDMSMHRRVVQKQNELSTLRKTHVEYDEAFEEVVCDALSTMISDGSFFEKLTEIKAKDKGLFNTIKKFFQDLIAKFKEAYATLTPEQKDARDIQDMKEMFDKIQTAFAEALVEANENFQASITTAESQSLADAGIGFDEETKSVYSVRFSPAYADSIKVGKKEFDAEAIAQIVAKGTGRSIEDARKWVKSEMAIANIVMQNPEFLDFEADNRYEAIKKNSDYPQGTVDLSNLCPKREEFTAMFDMLQKKYPNKLFTAQDVAEMRKILAKNGITVACGACFVEDRRQLIGEIADTYIQMWKEAVKTGKPLQKTNAAGVKSDLLVTKALAKQYGLTAGTKIMATDTYIPNQYDLTTYEGFKLLEKNHPTIAMGFNRYNNSRGQQSARLIEGRAEYNRQILGWSDAKVKTVNNNGGLRIFSFSDFEVVHLLDLVQVIIDCAARGVKIQGYTKIPAFAKLVRNTGVKLNRSLIPKGDYGYHMENGKVVLDYDTTEGININDENFVDESDNPNVGNIVIGINPTQIGAAMLDPFIDYIIPFHSNKAKAILEKLGTGKWVNYKESQHEKDIATGSASKHNVNIYTEVIAKYNPKNKVEFVEAFLKECKRQGKIPRYAEFLNVDENGNYTYREGYHKLLVDFKMFDKDGNILPQGNITPNLEESFMKDLLNAEVTKKSSYEFPKEVYDAIEKQFGEQKSIDNSPNSVDNKAKQKGGIVNDNGGIREGAAQATEVTGTDGGRYSDHPGTTQEKKSWQTLTNSDRKRINSIVDSHINSSKNYEEIFDLLCRMANTNEDEITPTQLRKAIRKITEKIYSDAVTMHPVIFESTWSIMGETSNLRKDILAVNQHGAKFSDRVYMDAVNRGDMETAQKMVDEAANEALKDSALRNRKIGGTLIKVYHATPNSFTVFDKKRIGHGFGSLFGKGFYFAKDRGIAEQYDKNIGEYYLNIKNPYRYYSTDKEYIVGMLERSGYDYDEEFVESYDTESLDSEDLIEDFLSEALGLDDVYEVFADMVQKAGFDGVWAGSDIVAFEPNQIKSADPVTYDDKGNVIPLSKRFNAENDDTRYSERTNAPVFYSQMGKVVEGMKQEKFGASSVISMLRGRGVKAEEIRWSGIQAFLDGKKSVTKAELLEFISSSMLHIEEDILGGVGKDGLWHEFYSQMNDVIPYFSTEEIEEMCFDYDGDFSKDKFESALQEYVDDGTISEIAFEEAIEYAEEMADKLKDDGTKWSTYTIEGGNNYRELLFKVPGSTYSNGAMTAHWGNDAQGILAHARVQDIVEDGKLMLFIEEIQSDWHNAGQKQGYFSEGDKVTVKNTELRHENGWYNLYHDGKGLHQSVSETFLKQRFANGITEEEIHEGLVDEYNRAIEHSGKGWKAPDAPFKGNYHEYVLKRLIRMAAEEGYDSIGWTTADIQSGRWSDEYAEGYRIEYDQDIPKFLRKYGKQWGAEVGKTEVNTDSIWSKEVWSMDITLAMKKSVLEEGQALYSERTGGDVSNRSLLAGAFEGIVQNSVEYGLIQEYKDHIKELNKLEDKLHSINDEIYKMRFTAGARDATKLQKLESEAKEIAKEINRYDKRLLNMEASEPLRKVIDRERKKASQKTREHVTQILQNKKARAEQTELRHKIRKAVRDLDKILNRGNKKQNVKEDMKGFVSKALELADYLFTDHISDDDIIRKGIDADLIAASGKAQLVKETEDILSKIYDQADSLTDEEFTRLDAKRKANEVKLRDLLTAQRNKMLNTPVYQLFNDLVIEYSSFANSKQEAVKAAYDPKVEEFLRSYVGAADSDRAKALQNMRVADMTTEELWKLHNAYQMVLHSVRTANKLFVNGKTASIEQMVTQIVTEFGSRQIPDKKMAIALQKLGNKIGWDYEKLYYALDRIGSDAFNELIMNLANSENIVMQDIMEAVEFRDQMVEKYGFNNWDINKQIDREFLDNTGKKFTMTLGQLMSLYAYSRREGAWDHIEYGGFVFGEAALTNPKPADSYKLSKENCESITGLLTKEQKGYVEDMQKFLSETMGGKGNEVSMMLYGIKMFGEKNYFPIHIAGQFKAQAQESKAKAAEGFQSMSNAGFTHAQNPNAKAPFVLEGFNEVWSDHVNEMSRYHGTVPALEDIRRVMNRSSYSENTAESTSVKVIMENHFGKEAVQYFDNLYREANSGAINDKLQKNPKKLLSLFRKNSVAYSLSVLVQQPASIVRAYAMIDRRHFGFKGVGTITSGVAKAVSSKWNKAYANAYNEMLKYAPGVTMTKEIGGFDTATGGSIRSHLLDTGKSFWQKMKTGTHAEKVMAHLDKVDNNAIANLPNVADKIAWIEIWNACKRETVAKHKDLKPNSEAFMQAVGERFTEVIRATQVYDSIFAKSPMLKSKNLYVQMLVSFMNEPNTVANMAEKAVRDLMTKGNRMQGARTAHVLIHSIIFTCVMKSLIYAMRDDDEDETYIEKYMEALVSSFRSDTMLLNYLPFGRDIVSLVQGYDVERQDMAIFDDVISAIVKLDKYSRTDTEDMTEEQLIELDKKKTEASWKLAESLAAFIGIPVKNIRRDVMGIVNTVTADVKKTTGMSLSDAVKDAWVESGLLAGEGKSKTDKLYAAITEGDATYVERIKNTYKDEDAYHNAVRKALRENDGRIKDAAMAQINGDPSERVRIAKQIIADIGKEYFDDVISAINSEISALSKGDGTESEPKVKGSYKVADFVTEMANGDYASLAEIRNDIISTAMANGKTKAEAEDSFVNGIKSAAKESYFAGTLSDARAKKLLREYAGMDEDDIYWTMREWEYQAETGTSEGYSKYNDFYAAVETGRNLTEVIEEYTAHGVERQRLASQITSYFKPLYREMTPAERYDMKWYLLDAYSALGYNWSDKSKDIDKWLED